MNGDGLSVCLIDCLSVLSICLLVCLATSLPACMSVSLLIYLPACLPTCLSACLSVGLLPAVWLSIYCVYACLLLVGLSAVLLAGWLSVGMPKCLSDRLSACLLRFVSSVRQSRQLSRGPGRPIRSKARGPKWGQRGAQGPLGVLRRV